jgi:hypothetical protein
MQKEERCLDDEGLRFFDVDETLEVSNGPVTLASVAELRNQGHIVGVCGNMNVACRIPNWHMVFSFLGQGYMPKALFLHGLKANIIADEFIMVGNLLGRVNKLGFKCGSNDNEHAAQAGWRFILEDAFSDGER